MVDDAGGLVAGALVAAEGGSWSGLLFDNPVLGLAPALTWSCSVPLEPVGGEPAALVVDWLPWAVADWRAVVGLEVSCGSFAEPVEAGVSWRLHHRYDRVAVRVVAQEGDRVRVVVTVAGDIDGLGPPEVTVDAWLSFGGVVVQLSGVSSAAQALRRLAGLTETAGLVELGDPRGIAFRFGPG